MVHRVTLRVPASTSNLGPGFDAIGLAVALFNEFEFTRADAGVLRVRVEGEGADIIPGDAGNRTYAAFRSFFAGRGEEPPGVHIHQRNRIPLARGLGGSGTAVLAGTLAAMLFAGMDHTPDAVLDHAITVETHPDNITPSLVGGLTVSLLDEGHVRYVRVLPPAELTAVLLIPDRGLETGAARAVVPQTFSREDTIYTLRGAAMVMAALATGQLEHLAVAMRDRVHQPYRAPLLPGMMEIFEAALGAGSPGVALSGAGSGIFAFAYPATARRIGDAMLREARRHGLGGYVLYLPIDTMGTVILEIQ